MCARRNVSHPQVRYRSPLGSYVKPFQASSRGSSPTCCGSRALEAKSYHTNPRDKTKMEVDDVLDISCIQLSGLFSHDCSYPTAEPVASLDVDGMTRLLWASPAKQTRTVLPVADTTTTGRANSRQGGR